MHFNAKRIFSISSHPIHNVIDPWTETWRRVWGTEQISRTNFSNDLLLGKNSNLTQTFLMTIF